MYCSKCGAVNNDNAVICANCRTPLGGPAMAAPPPPPVSVNNYLVPAILVTIFCCWPFGIPAIVFAAKVNGLAAAGDVAGAVEASNKAKMWCWVSAGGWLAAVVLYVLFIILMAALGEM